MPVIIFKGVENAMELFEKFSPALYFHPEENAFPIGLNTLIEHSSLVMRMSDGREIRLDSGSFTMSELDTMKELWKKRGFTDQELEGAIFSLDPDLKENSLNDTKENEKNPVVHVAPALVNLTDKRSEREQSYLRLTYLYVLAINNPQFLIASSIAKLLRLAQPGFHKADIEHVSVYIPLKKSIESDHIGYSLADPVRVARAYYSAHGSAEGTWVKNPKVEKDTHIKVYVAQGSHANYPSKGIYIPLPGPIKRFLNHIHFSFLIPETGFIPRVLGFANDHIGLNSTPNISTGASITSIPNLIKSNEQDIEFDAGNFEVGVYKDFVKGKECPKSTNWFIRLLPLPFMKHFMKMNHQEIEVIPLDNTQLQPEYENNSWRYLSRLSQSSSKKLQVSSLDPPKSMSLFFERAQNINTLFEDEEHIGVYNSI